MQKVFKNLKGKSWWIILSEIVNFFQILEAAIKAIIKMLITNNLSWDAMCSSHRDYIKEPKFWYYADYFCCQHLKVWFGLISRVCISPQLWLCYVISVVSHLSYSLEMLSHQNILLQIRFWKRNFCYRGIYGRVKRSQVR